MHLDFYISTYIQTECNPFTALLPDRFPAAISLTNKRSKCWYLHKGVLQGSAQVQCQCDSELEETWDDSASTAGENGITWLPESTQLKARL